MVYLKSLKSFIELNLKKDKTSFERLELNKVKSTIESLCDQYLENPNDILTFEALPSAIEYVVELFTSGVLSEKYEYDQITDTLFRIKLRELELGI